MLNSERGSALVIVLVISLLLLASSFWAISTFRAGVKATEALAAKFEARLGAESALQILKYYAATGRFSYSTLTNNLPRNLSFPAQFSLTGKKEKINLNKATIYISLQDSSGMLNSYYMDGRVLERLLHGFGLASQDYFIIGDSFKDWVDHNDFNRINGAESYFYRNQKVAYRPRNNNALQSIWEVSLIRGVNSTVWSELRPFLTLVPKPGHNIQTMSPAMLAAYFGLDQEQALTLANSRNDTGYLTISSIEDITGRKYAGLFSGLGNFPSRMVHILIDAQSGNSREQWRGVLSLLPDRQGPYRILSWQEGRGD